MKLSRHIGIALGLLVFAPQAWAQEFAPSISGRSGEEHVRSGIGISVQAGGGVTNFTLERARDTTGIGGFWEARAVLGTRRILGLEAAYVGSARELGASGLSNSAALVGHGVEAALRLNVPILVYGALVEPFAFGGLGWTRYGLVSEGVNTSRIAGSDNVGVVPFGGGLAIGYRGFIADARFTYRMTFEDETLLPGSDAAALQNWGVGLLLGYEF